MDENELLMKKVVDGGHEFHAIYLPNVLVFQVLWHERRYQKTLQDMCNMYATQVGECEIREENLQTITTTHGFHMYGFDR